MSDVKINQVSESFYTATVPNKAAFAVEFTSGEVPKFDPADQFNKKPTKVPRSYKDKGKVKTIDFAAWGKDNKLPNHLLGLLLGNNLAPGVMDTKDQILIGDDLVFYYEDFADGKKMKVPFYSAEHEDFLEEVEAFQFLEEAAIDYNWFANIFAKLSYGNKAGGKANKITKIRHIDAVDCRASVMDPDKKRSLYYGVADWTNGKKDQIDIYHGYDPDEVKQAQEFVLHMKKRTPGNPYYPLPAYIGAQHWIRHANRIPIWKISNMENAVNIKYHIQIPERYFMNQYPDPEFNREFRKKKREELIDQITGILAGSDNVSKTFYSEFAIDPANGKELPGWKIEPIKNEINHEAYSQDFNDSNSAILSSLSLDPTLSNVLLPSGLGGTGAKDREAYNVALKKTRYGRAFLLRPFELAMKINKLDRMKIEGKERRIYLGIQDEMFQTLDVNPTGKTNVI